MGIFPMSCLLCGDYLQRLKEGDLTEEYNIDRTCYEKLVSELTSDERSMSDSFLKVVADVLAKQTEPKRPQGEERKVKEEVQEENDGTPEFGTRCGHGGDKKGGGF